MQGFKLNHVSKRGHSSLGIRVISTTSMIAMKSMVISIPFSSRELGPFIKVSIFVKGIGTINKSSRLVNHSKWVTFFHGPSNNPDSISLESCSLSSMMCWAANFHGRFQEPFVFRMPSIIHVLNFFRKQYVCTLYSYFTLRWRWKPKPFLM